MKHLKENKNMVDQYKQWSNKQKSGGSDLKNINVYDYKTEQIVEIEVPYIVDLEKYKTEIINFMVDSENIPIHIVNSIRNMSQELIDRINNHRDYEQNWAEDESFNFDIHEFHVRYESYFIDCMMKVLIGENDYGFNFEILDTLSEGSPNFYNVMYDILGESIKHLKLNI